MPARMIVTIEPARRLWCWAVSARSLEGTMMVMGIARDRRVRGWYRVADRASRSGDGQKWSGRTARLASRLVTVPLLRLYRSGYGV